MSKASQSPTRTVSDSRPAGQLSGSARYQWLFDNIFNMMSDENNYTVVPSLTHDPLDFTIQCNHEIKSNSRASSNFASALKAVQEALNHVIKSHIQAKNNPGRVNMLLQHSRAEDTTLTTVNLVYCEASSINDIAQFIKQHRDELWSEVTQRFKYKEGYLLQ